MSWYAAHIIMYVRFKEGKQDFYPVYENIILIDAKTGKEAHKKAVERAKSDEGDSSGTCFYGDRPAEMVFSGIRKIIACEDSEKRPGDGTEITYSEFEVNSEDNLLRLVNGESVNIIYED